VIICIFVTTQVFKVSFNNMNQTLIHFSFCRLLVLSFWIVFFTSCGEVPVASTAGTVAKTEQTVQKEQEQTEVGSTESTDVQTKPQSLEKITPGDPEMVGENQGTELTSQSSPLPSTNSTLRVAGKAVVFYFPTNEDMLNTPETEANAGIVEILSDFENNARSFQANHDLKGVQVLWSTDKDILVHLENGTQHKFTRNLSDRVVGAIFTDGKKEPKEIQSLLSETEYRVAAKKFFGQ